MKKFILLIFLASILMSCGGPKAFFDYDESANFQSYEKFSFYDDLKTDMQEFDAQRFKNSLDSLMTQKGLVKSDQPDFKVDFFADYFRSSGRGSNVGVSVGGFYGNMPVNKQELYISITLNFIDAKTDKLFWQAVVEGSLENKLRPQERAEFFYKMAEKALSKYPPNAPENTR